MSINNNTNFTAMTTLPALPVYKRNYSIKSVLMSGGVFNIFVAFAISLVVSFLAEGVTGWVHSLVFIITFAYAYVSAQDMTKAFVEAHKNSQKAFRKEQEDFAVEYILPTFVKVMKESGYKDYGSKYFASAKDEGLVITATRVVNFAGEGKEQHKEGMSYRIYIDGVSTDDFFVLTSVVDGSYLRVEGHVAQY